MEGPSSRLAGVISCLRSRPWVFRAIAPDMRGYGRSSIYPCRSDYAQELIVQDMLELQDSLGRERAVWVGHDWGSPVVWNLASHHPDRCEGVANLCVPYYSIERGLDHTITLVDRKVYPEDEYPAGNWDYMRYYEENFAEAIAPMDANVYKFLKLAFRKGDPAGEGKPAITATARRNHGMLGGAVPDLPRDGDIVSEEDLSVYVSALERNDFFGPSSWYLNHSANAEYAKAATTATSTCRCCFSTLVTITSANALIRGSRSRCASTVAISRKTRFERATGWRRRSRPR